MLIETERNAPLVTERMNGFASGLAGCTKSTLDVWSVDGRITAAVFSPPCGDMGPLYLNRETSMRGVPISSCSFNTVRSSRTWELSLTADFPMLSCLPGEPLYKPPPTEAAATPGPTPTPGATPTAVPAKVAPR